MRVWCVCIIAAAGCGRFAFDPTADSTAPVTACATWGNWSAPVLETALNSSVNDFGATLTEDGLLLCVSSARPGGVGAQDVWCSERADPSAPFPPPVILPGPVNTTAGETDLAMTVDALELFFSSNRGGGAGGKDPYVATRAVRGDPFAPAVAISALATAVGDEIDAISDDGLRLYYSTPVAPDGTQLFVTTRASRMDTFGPGQLIAELTSPNSDDGLALRHDELEVVFGSTRTGGQGGRDVYRATRASLGEPFTTPVRVAEISSTTDDLPAAFTADGATLYLNFNMDLSGTIQSDLWSTTRACLDP